MSFRRDYSHLLDKIKGVKLSDQLQCIADETSIVCIGDWFYYQNRFTDKVLRRVDNDALLITILRQYGADILHMNLTSEARSIITQIVSRIQDPVVMYSTQLSSSLYIGGVFVEFDRIIIFSHSPYIVYLVKGNTIVGYVDMENCTQGDLCRSAEYLFRDALNAAHSKFREVFST